MSTYTSDDSSLTSKCMSENKPTIKFTFEKVVLNNREGWLASKRIEGVFSGTLFGKTKKEAMQAFDFSRVTTYDSRQSWRG